jgi:hypothetical protein
MPAARPVLPALRGPPRAAWRAAQPVAGLVQDAGHGPASVCRDDLGDLVADELVVGDTHEVDSTARLSAAKWQRVAIPGRAQDPGE